MNFNSITLHELKLILQNISLTEDQIDTLISHNMVVPELFTDQPFSEKLLNYAIKEKKHAGIKYYFENYLENFSSTQLSNILDLLLENDFGKNLREFFYHIADQEIQIPKNFLTKVADFKLFDALALESIILPLKKFNLIEPLNSSDLRSLLNKFTDMTIFNLMPVLEKNELVSFLTSKTKVLRERAKMLLGKEYDKKLVLEFQAKENLKDLNKNLRKNNWEKINTFIDPNKGNTWISDFTFVNPYWYGSESSNTVTFKDYSQTWQIKNEANNTSITFTNPGFYTF